MPVWVRAGLQLEELAPEEARVEGEGPAGGRAVGEGLGEEGVVGERRGGGRRVRGGGGAVGGLVGWWDGCCLR